MSEIKTLGYEDEPQESGAVVAVHWGDYRRQEIWVRSGANIGNWYPLGGEFGRPKPWVDPRNELEKMGIQRGPVPARTRCRCTRIGRTCWRAAR